MSDRAGQARRPSPPTISEAAEAVLGGRAEVLALWEEWLRREGVTDARIVFQAHDDALPPEGLRRADIRHGSEVYGMLQSEQMDPETLSRWARDLGASLHLADRLALLAHHATTDGLTGAGNRRSFEEYIGRSIAAAEAKGLPLKLMLFDIDDFKNYNDRFGHAAGDEVLRETVSLLRSVIRRGDAVFRLGGDEFAVVFGDPDSPRASGSPAEISVDQVATRFSEGIRTLHLPALGEHGLGRLSVSAGMATFPDDGRDATSLLAAADRRAFESKRRGKGAITFGPDRQR